MTYTRFRVLGRPLLPQTQAARSVFCNGLRFDALGWCIAVQALSRAAVLGQLPASGVVTGVVVRVNTECVRWANRLVSAGLI
jgi:hypothetical protein